MLNEIVLQILSIFLDIFISIPFGSFMITLGSLIYAPTGNRVGKYCLFLGLLIFTLYVFIL